MILFPNWLGVLKATWANLHTGSAFGLATPIFHPHESWITYIILPSLPSQPLINPLPKPIIETLIRPLTLIHIVSYNYSLAQYESCFPLLFISSFLFTPPLPPNRAYHVASLPMTPLSQFITCCFKRLELYL